MLNKLIKHDFRGQGRTLYPMNIAVVAAGAVMAALLTATVRFHASAAYTAQAKAVFTAIAALPLVLLGLAIASSVILSLVFISFNFYKNLMGDEGYLTFTLPVTTGEILWSKLITGFAFILMNAAAILLAGLLVIFIGTSSTAFINPDVMQIVAGLPIAGEELAKYMNAPLLAVEGFVSVLVSLVASLLKIFFAVTIGGMLAKKHKLLAAIGMYFAVNMAMGIVSGLFKLIFGVGLVFQGSAIAEGFSAEAMMNATFLYGIGTSLVFAVLFFLLTRLILKKHLNLQ